MVLTRLIVMEEGEGEDAGHDMRFRITLRTLSFVLTAWKLLAPTCTPAEEGGRLHHS